jgi:NhaA family Na+:H+ antiporter
MATDIAFAVGRAWRSSASACRRPCASSSSRVAIIDDIGAHPRDRRCSTRRACPGQGFALAGAGRRGDPGTAGPGRASAPLAYVPAGALVSGPASPRPASTRRIAGVLIGLLDAAPGAWYGVPPVPRRSRRQRARPSTAGGGHGHELDAADALELARRRTARPTPPVERSLEHPSPLGRVPDHAGVRAGQRRRASSTASSSAPRPARSLGVGLGLVIGKPLGVLAACALALQPRRRAAPARRRHPWPRVVVGMVAGVGFTMALFIAALAFPADPTLHGVAKLGVLVASAIAAIGAFAYGRLALPAAPSAGAAATAHEAEASTQA